MKRFAALLAALCAAHAFAADHAAATARYLESIRASEAALTAFFHRMPKGGDLHNHFSGAVYAESFFDSAVAKHFVIDTATMQVYQKRAQSPHVRTVIAMDSLPDAVRADFKNRLIRLWSVKDFTPCDGAPDAHFFNTFGLFGATLAGSVPGMLRELKLRAIAEHTQYLETMFIRAGIPWSPEDSVFIATFSPRLREAQKARDAHACDVIFDEMRTRLDDSLGAGDLAKNFQAMMVALRNAAALPDGKDSLVTVRFLNYCVRVAQPADVFSQLYVSFLSCDNDSLLVGVNIVAPENNDVAMADYWLHMQMFRYLRARFPAVKTTLHAGELVRGMVKPEELTWHITEAVETAGANRIGHGVDIANEADAYALLRDMKVKDVAIEINLTSNEFILGIHHDAHPITLYAAFGVPIVISTDDPGVLRSDHTGEFVRLAKRYPQFTYEQIKQFVYNSISHSFLNARDKRREGERLDGLFEQFEADIAGLER